MDCPAESVPHSGRVLRRVLLAFSLVLTFAAGMAVAQLVLSAASLREVLRTR